MAKNFTPRTFEHAKPGEEPRPCFGCSRTVMAFELIDISQVDNTVLPGKFRCTSCGREALRQGRITRDEFIAALEAAKLKNGDPL